MRNVSTFLWSENVVSLIYSWLSRMEDFPGGSDGKVKCLSTMWETWVQSLGWEDSLEKEMATHSSTLALKILWTEELGAGYCPWGQKELGTTERLHFLSFFLKGSWWLRSQANYVLNWALAQTCCVTVGQVSSPLWASVCFVIQKRRKELWFRDLM